MLSSDDVAVWTCSLLCVCREDWSDSCNWFSIWIECSWSSMHMPAKSWVGMRGGGGGGGGGGGVVWWEGGGWGELGGGWGGGVAVLSWMLCMSSWRSIWGEW